MLSPQEELFKYFDGVVHDLFPSNHAAAIAYNKYKVKKVSSLSEDCTTVYAKYKSEIHSGDTEWLKNNLVYIGTKTCGIYFSMIFNKTRDDEVISAFVTYMRTTKVDVHSASKSSSDTEDSSSDTEDSASDTEDSNGDDKSPLDIIKAVYASIQPKLAEVVTTMEMPPPDGVHLSKKNIAIKQADLATVKGGINEFESLIDIHM